MTNFEKMTASPEVLVEEMVFYQDGLWGFIRNGILYRREQNGSGSRILKSEINHLTFSFNMLY